MEMIMTRHVRMPLKLAKEKGYTFIHPFDDLDVATGQGTISMEIIKDFRWLITFWYLSEEADWLWCSHSG